jgi:hypothetical protein
MPVHRRPLFAVRGVGCWERFARCSVFGVGKGGAPRRRPRAQVLATRLARRIWSAALPSAAVEPVTEGCGARKLRTPYTSLGSFGGWRKLGVCCLLRESAHCRNFRATGYRSSQWPHRNFPAACHRTYWVEGGCCIMGGWAHGRGVRACAGTVLPQRIRSFLAP